MPNYKIEWANGRYFGTANNGIMLDQLVNEVLDRGFVPEITITPEVRKGKDDDHSRRLRPSEPAPGREEG